MTAMRTAALLAFLGGAAAAVRGGPNTAHEGAMHLKEGAAAQANQVSHGRPTLLTIVAPVKPWDKTVVHKKEAGNGYLKGSPLYKKQEALEKKTVWEALKTFDFKAAWKAITWKHIGYVFIDQFIWVILVLLVAYFYQKNKPMLSEKSSSFIENRPDWKYGLFDCSDMFSSDLSICGMACCCPAIRWADTMSNPKVAFHEKEDWGAYNEQTGLTFWKALAIVIVLVFLGPFTLHISTLVLFCVFIYYRQKLRVIFHHSPGGASYVWDCLAYCCCACCAMVQEAREVENVRKPTMAAGQS